MYADIYGSGESMWCKVFMVLVLVALVIIIGLLSTLVNKAGFENLLHDYGIRQRREVIAATPAFHELSLQQKVDNAAATVATGVTTSQLTGSRDIPVFFQDYNIEASRNKGGAVSTAREGFSGKADDDLEKALAGH